MAKLYVWTLGSIEHRILPTNESISKLANALSTIDMDVGGHIIWGPELNVNSIDVDETITQIVVPDDLEVRVDGSIISVIKKDSADGDSGR